MIEIFSGRGWLQGARRIRRALTERSPTPIVSEGSRTSFLETSLDAPLRDVLPIIQERILERTTWFGVPALKNPLDFWIYQELVYELRPDVIIEIGNWSGGSALAMAHLCDLLDHGRVLAIDLDHRSVPERVRQHPRIALIDGDAVLSYERVLRHIRATDQVLIIEDSSHTYDNTLMLLRTYSPLIKRGGYFVVEDGICHHGLDVGPTPGPFEAIETFVLETSDFVIDRQREDFLITWNPKGFLKRVS